MTPLDSGGSAKKNRGFTVWLDPSRWPVAQLKLPGKGFTVWALADRWPRQPLRLPGEAHTIWQNPHRWPQSLIRLPASGFTVWLEGEGKTNPGSGMQKLAPGPVEVAPLVSLPDRPAILPPGRPVVIAFPGAPGGLGSPADSPEPPHSVPSSAHPVAAQAPEIMPISISQNHGFTLWTKPSQVVPIPMKNGQTAAQFAASHPAPVRQVPVSTLQPAAALPLAAKPETAPVPWNMIERWMPLGAAVVALFALNTLSGLADSRRSGVSRSELEDLRQQLNGAQSQLAAANAAAGKTGSPPEAASAGAMEAAARSAKQDKDLLLSELATAHEAGRKWEDRSAQQEMVIRQMTRELNDAKSAVAAAGTKAETAIVANNEEASKIKREAAAEVVKLKEIIGRLEAEKAAAIKAAAESAAAMTALQKPGNTPGN